MLQDTQREKLRSTPLELLLTIAMHQQPAVGIECLPWEINHFPPASRCNHPKQTEPCVTATAKARRGQGQTPAASGAGGPNLSHPRGRGTFLSHHHHPTAADICLLSWTSAQGFSDCALVLCSFRSLGRTIGQSKVPLP